MRSITTKRWNKLFTHVDSHKEELGIEGVKGRLAMAALKFRGQGNGNE